MILWYNYFHKDTMGVRVISNYKKEYELSIKKRTRDQQELTEIETQIEALEKRRQQKKAIIAEDDNDMLLSGLRYYSAERRNTILNRAEELCYSKKEIENIRSFNDNDWNADNVAVETIERLNVIEQYVGNHMTWWEKSPFSKIGAFLNNDDEDVDNDN